MKICYFPFDLAFCNEGIRQQILWHLSWRQCRMDSGLKFMKKTADKQKDVRYNGCRTKSNAALSMNGKDSLGFFWLIKIEGVVFYGY